MATAAHYQALLSTLGTQSGREKVAARMDNFVKDREKVDMMFTKVWPEQKIEKTDRNLHPSTTQDTMNYLVESEPEARAMTGSFRGEPRIRYYTSRRFYAPFYPEETEELQQSEMDLMAYGFDIEKMVKDKALNALNEVSDRRKLIISEGAVQILQREEQGLAYTAALTNTQIFTARNVASGAVPQVGKVKSKDAIGMHDASFAENGANDTEVWPIQKDDITELLKLFPGTGGPRKSHLSCEVMLMTETDKLDMNNWSSSEAGDDIVKETTVNGYKYSTVQGQKFAVTKSTSVLRPGNLYAFAPRDYVGGCLTLQPLKSYVDRVKDRFTWQAKRIICTYVGNVAGIRKLELYAGSSDLNIDSGTVPGGNAAVMARFAPLAEEELGALNNLIRKGGTVPNVTDF